MPAKFFLTGEKIFLYRPEYSADAEQAFRFIEQRAFPFVENLCPIP